MPKKGPKPLDILDISAYNHNRDVTDVSVGKKEERTLDSSLETE